MSAKLAGQTGLLKSLAALLAGGRIRVGLPTPARCMHGNFYPMPTVLQNANHRLTLCSRQSLDVASLQPSKGINLSEILVLFMHQGASEFFYNCQFVWQG